MKKSLSVILILVLYGTLMVAGEPQTKPEDIWKDFCVEATSQPVDDHIKAGFDSIVENDIESYLKFLSSDLLQGRETATAEYDIAAEYVASLFTIWGIIPAGDQTRENQKPPFPWMQPEGKPQRTYFQQVDLKEVLNSKSRITVRWASGSRQKTRVFESDLDFTYYHKDTHSLTGQVVFVGYGISEKKLNYDEYKNLDVRGKIVLMLTETPGKNDPASPFNREDIREKYNPRRRSHRMISPKVSMARERGALAVLLVENSPQENGDVATRIMDSKKVDDSKPIFPTQRKRLSLISVSEALPWESLPYVRISQEMADTLLGFAGTSIKQFKESIEKKPTPGSSELSGVSLTLENQAEVQLARSRNVLGYIEGSDPQLKNEVVVIGAHLDHLGRKGDYIFNGADDNGSGSAAVMEVAEAFARNPVRPKRSVLFALWTGEEEGLLGSRFYIDHPVFPLKKTVACFNLDMISREWTIDGLKMINRMWRLGMPEEAIEKTDTKKFISLSIDAGAESLYRAIQENNRYLGLSIYLHKSESRSWGSDHAPFAQNNIPWIFFFAATTQDYHQPSDSIEKTSSSLIQKYARLVYLAAFCLANR